MVGPRRNILEQGERLEQEENLKPKEEKVEPKEERLEQLEQEEKLENLENKKLCTYYMKLVLRTLVFHMLCIIVFAFVYKYLSTNFDNDKGKYNDKDNDNMIDYFLLSVTIQAGIGISGLYPISYLSKLALMLHQFIIISTHVFTLYIFTI